MKNKIKEALKKGIQALIQEMVNYGAVISRPVKDAKTWTDFNVSIKDPAKYAEFQEFQKEAEKELAREEWIAHKRAKDQEKNSLK